MGITVGLSPASINFPVTAPGATNTASTRCGLLPAPVLVTVSLSSDTSQGALTILSMKSFVLKEVLTSNIESSNLTNSQQ